MAFTRTHTHTQNAKLEIERNREFHVKKIVITDLQFAPHQIALKRLFGGWREWLCGGCLR